MSTANSFNRFCALPPELRLQIWREALTSPSVCRYPTPPAFNDQFGRDQGANRPPSIDRLVFIGPASFLAGMACWESRHMLEKLYGQPIEGPGDNAQWIYWDTTIIYIADLPNDRLGPSALAALRHVALPWGYMQFRALCRACQWLAKSCPELRTIVIQMLHEDAAVLHSGSSSFAAASAARASHAALMDYPGRVPCDDLDVGHFESLLLQYFGDPYPKLHILPPDFG